MRRTVVHKIFIPLYNSARRRGASDGAEGMSWKRYYFILRNSRIFIFFRKYFHPRQSIIKVAKISIYLYPLLMETDRCDGGCWVAAYVVPQKLACESKKVVEEDEKMNFVAFCLFEGSFSESIFHLKMWKMFEYFPAHSFAKEYYSSTNLCWFSEYDDPADIIPDEQEMDFKMASNWRILQLLSALWKVAYKFQFNLIIIVFHITFT